MQNNIPRVICSSNLSHAWAQIFLDAMDSKHPALSPITLCIEPLNNQCPEEDATVRKALDETLATYGKKSCSETATTIFPYKTWMRMGRPRCDEFSDFYLGKCLPRHAARVKLQRGKFVDTYFSRMIRVTGVRRVKGNVRIQETRQLSYISEQWHQNPKKRPRHSSLMATCFDPVKDQIGSAQGGFPCLHEVSFGYDDEGQMAINAFYPTEYIFERAYGNYLGLCHLGLFMAQELGLKLAQFNCFIGRPERSALPKQKLRRLEQIVLEVTPPRG